MNKIHQIPTDTFVPISHDNSYLFTHYDKVANFLAFNLDQNYKNILAKPVQNGYMFDWFSVYENLVNINKKGKEESDLGLLKYWAFIDLINAKINQLAASNDDNNKNWADLLTKVFNHNDNFIFSNGKDISIVWGWKFNNNENYKPNITKSTSPSPLLNLEGNAVIEDFAEINKEPEIEPVNPVTEPIQDNENRFEEESIEEIPIEEIPEDTLIEESSFLKFLKWFASNFWWLLGLLLLLIIFFLLLKSCDCNDHYNDINTKLNQLEQKAKDCGN